MHTQREGERGEEREWGEGRRLGWREGEREREREGRRLGRREGESVCVCIVQLSHHLPSFNLCTSNLKVLHYIQPGHGYKL